MCTNVLLYKWHILNMFGMIIKMCKLIRYGANALIKASQSLNERM